jgi:hypothetical protein
MTVIIKAKQNHYKTEEMGREERRGKKSNQHRGGVGGSYILHTYPKLR